MQCLFIKRYSFWLFLKGVNVSLCLFCYTKKRRTDISFNLPCTGWHMCITNQVTEELMSYPSLVPQTKPIDRHQTAKMGFFIVKAEAKYKVACKAFSLLIKEIHQQVS